MAAKLSDNEVGDRLFAALQVIGDAKGETIAGDTALKTARSALKVLQLGLVAEESGLLNRTPLPARRCD